MEIIKKQLCPSCGNNEVYSDITDPAKYCHAIIIRKDEIEPGLCGMAFLTRSYAKCGQPAFVGKNCIVCGSTDLAPVKVREGKPPRFGNRCYSCLLAYNRERWAKRDRKKKK